VEELARVLQGGGEASSEGLAVALSGLEAYLAARFRLSAGDSSEVASEAITRFLEQCLSGGVDPERAAGLVTVMARNIAVDTLRRTGRETPTGNVENEIDSQYSRDDEIAALLDQGADRSAIVEAMEAALAIGDLVTVRVVRAWLDLADQLGRAPTTREVAAEAGVSHSTVVRALHAFRQFVPDGPSRAKTR
jgi:DNA-directed RNA polymerase specialized sigma24 family protein